ncbi:acyl-N-acyltransferase [Colletotrichum tofieldiae]|nr:acyl-N-acyltransferase [Colletotrichum tofieldiae]GKT88687.1 acyl-N-acyltransferase [Colletotrichum tofieldiae]
MAGRNFEKSQKKRETDTVAKCQVIQNNEDMPSVTAMRQASVAEYIPPHKRSIKPKVNIEVEVPNQEQPIITGYYAKSATESTGGHANPRASLPEPTKESTPLTPMALRDLSERHGVADKSKKSHPSMDISVDDEVTSSHEYGSSRFSNFFDKTAAYAPSGPASAFFHTWLDTLSADCVTSFLDEVDNHHNYDVDPTNGQLLEKVEQPDTIVDIEEEIRMRPAMLHRRRDWTSNLVIHREITVRRNLMRRQQEERERECSNLPTQERQSNKNITITSTTKPATVIISNKRKLLADCVLRPAQLDDAKGCAEIYNAAVADHDYQVVDTNPVSAQRFEFVITECQRERLPFVVATKQKVDLSDANNWPSQEAYRQYMKWKESQPQKNEPTENSIYGFGFLKPYERGIGGLTGTASPVVKATVFVHPDHRRGGIGSALLHQLLTQTSILYYGNVVEYKWHDPTTGGDSFRASNFHNVHRIIFHTMVKSEGSQSLEWMGNFMSSFQFEKCGRLNQVYKVDSPHGAEWYDQVVWQHWANKIDSVRTLHAGDESECSYDYPGKSHSPGYRRSQSPVVGEKLRCSSGHNSDDVFGH